MVCHPVGDETGTIGHVKIKDVFFAFPHLHDRIEKVIRSLDGLKVLDDFFISTDLHSHP